MHTVMHKGLNSPFRAPGFSVTPRKNLRVSPLLEMSIWLYAVLDHHVKNDHLKGLDDSNQEIEKL